jgi:hypothetical protein
LCTYVKQAGSIQEQLEMTLKYGGNTRPWTSMKSRSLSIDKSYDSLIIILKDKGRLNLIAKIDKNLNKQIFNFSEQIFDIFEKLQSGTFSTLQYVVPTYYLISNLCKINDNDHLIIKQLKLNMSKNLYEKFWPSIKSLHWLACYFDPSFKELSFVPQNKFRTDLIEDLNNWAISLLQDAYNAFRLGNVNVDQNIEIIEETNLLNKTSDPFSSLRDASSTYVKQETGVSLNINNELRSYKFLKIVQHYDHPLIFWKQNQVEFPIISRACCRLYVIPATSAQSERDFSSVGWTLNKRQSRLNPKNLESIELLHSAFISHLK